MRGAKVLVSKFVRAFAARRYVQHREAEYIPFQEFLFCYSFLFLFVFRSKSIAMVMAGRSVHLSTLFPGQAWTSG